MSNTKPNYLLWIFLKSVFFLTTQENISVLENYETKKCHPYSPSDRLEDWYFSWHH